MTVRYNKLWKRLIDMKIKESALTKIDGVQKFSQDEYVRLGIIERICRALYCDMGDVVQILSLVSQNL